jgi:hypothetical protein
MNQMKEEPGTLSMVSDYGLDDQAIDIRLLAKSVFPLTSVSRLALGPTQPPVQWVPGVKHGRERGADHSPPFSAEVMNA